ncbi:hypothetical protein LO762_10585 [Actinocorallia sp. API 0066]|uniref:hypothetical protein n=1 Tax=Actinocorallia sp. API 0066 TaxID=2896846 RepID=UPI001E2CFFD4|nr:hypothetical protein [Actinocorallia sp. API 0066]MCD0449634.1 hypothetical protein [Actinocorallia sp. API 0066]
MNRSFPLSRPRRRALTVPRALAVVAGLIATGVPAALIGPAAPDATHTPVDDPVVAGTEDAVVAAETELHW